MDAEVVYVDGCPNWPTAHERLARALELFGAGDTPVSLRRVTSGAEAESAGFAGSPTILVDGHDLFPGARAPGAPDLPDLRRSGRVADRG